MLGPDLAEWFVSFWLWVRRMWGWIGLSVALASNPEKILKGLGVLSPSRTLTLSPGEFRALAAVLLFLGLFWWFHRARMAYEVARPLHPTEPLPEVLRYIAQRSKWASRQRPPDELWVIAFEKEFVGRLGRRELTAFGRRFLPKRERTISEIDASVWRQAARFSAFEIMLENTTKQTVEGDAAAFDEVVFDRQQVRRTWPRRGWLDALLRRSPAERTGLVAEWHKQDRKLDAMEKRIAQDLLQRLNEGDYRRRS